mmetsp:Transcript_17369/g.54949  ORF Transcript_17369/g.54949 Transcript_17369/m.54949 type:complete len:275 (-) Transcript_17369:440-1264(-)
MGGGPRPCDVRRCPRRWWCQRKEPRRGRRCRGAGAPGPDGRNSRGCHSAWGGRCVAGCRRALRLGRDDPRACPVQGNSADGVGSWTHLGVRAVYRSLLCVDQHPHDSCEVARWHPMGVCAHLAHKTVSPAVGRAWRGGPPRCANNSLRAQGLFGRVCPCLSAGVCLGCPGPGRVTHWHPSQVPDTRSWALAALGGRARVQGLLRRAAHHGHLCRGRVPPQGDPDPARHGLRPEAPDIGPEGLGVLRLRRHSWSDLAGAVALQGHRLQLRDCSGP